MSTERPPDWLLRLRFGPPEAPWRTVRLPQGRQLWLVATEAGLRWRRHPGRGALLTARAMAPGLELQALEAPALEHRGGPGRRLLRLGNEAFVVLEGVQGVALRVKPARPRRAAAARPPSPLRRLASAAWQRRYRALWLGAHLQTLTFAGLALWMVTGGLNRTSPEVRMLARSASALAHREAVAPTPAAPVAAPVVPTPAAAPVEPDPPADPVDPLTQGDSGEVLDALAPGLDVVARVTVAAKVAAVEASPLLGMVADREGERGTWARVRQALADAGLNPLYAGLPVTESSLCPYALSPNREGLPNAAGPWQFVGKTARRFGLAVPGLSEDEGRAVWRYADRAGGGDRDTGLALCPDPEGAPWMDERQDEVASTAAAVAYLGELEALARDHASADHLDEADVILFVLTAWNQGEGFIESTARLPGPTSWSLAVDAWKPVAAGLEGPREVAGFAPGVIARALVLARILELDGVATDPTLRAPMAL